MPFSTLKVHADCCWNTATAAVAEEAIKPEAKTQETNAEGRNKEFILFSFKKRE